LSASRSFREALGRYPTGVALITLMAEGRPMAMTVNSFASVSLDPPLILWSVDRAGKRYRLFRDTLHFAVNVLAADQEALSVFCAQNDDLGLSDAAWSPGQDGAPLVKGCVARFECSREAVHAGGDHDIIIGRVDAFDMPRTAPALVFHRSAYAQAG